MEKTDKQKQVEALLQNEKKEIPTQTELVTEAPRVHAGGIVHPAGYTHVGTIPNVDGSIRYNVEGLLEIVEIDELDGVSLKLDRGNLDPSFGVLHGRIIHDFHAFLHVFRCDYPEEKRTHFRTHLGHGSGAIA